jgi:hypothetical protein
VVSIPVPVPVKAVSIVVPVLGVMVEVSLMVPDSRPVPDVLSPRDFPRRTRRGNDREGSQNPRCASHHRYLNTKVSPPRLHPTERGTLASP